MDCIIQGLRCPVPGAVAFASHLERFMRSPSYNPSSCDPNKRTPLFRGPPTMRKERHAQRHHAFLR